MNYKDLIGIENPDFRTLAYIPIFHKLSKNVYIFQDYIFPDYLILKIHQVFGDKIIASVGNEGTKEIYDIKNINGKDYIIPNNDNYSQTCLDKMIFIGVVGEIKDNKIYSEYFRQGYIYKNDIVFEKTKHLSKEELDKLPLINKICYIPEHAFYDKEFIDLTSKELKDGKDYFSVYSIKEAIKEHYGNDVYRKIPESDLDNMVEDVFDTLDWQYPSSLLDADNYLDGYIEDLNAKNDIKKVILSTMLNFIGDNYGSQEMEDPCYDMEKMADEISNAIEKMNNSKEEEVVETYGF